MYKMYGPGRPARPEHGQDFRWHSMNGTAWSGGLRRQPEMPYIEWDPSIGRWRQGPRVKRNFEPNRYFTRPHDGKRPGWTGRFKDAMVGEGADVFITTSGDKRTLMRDRPQKWQWTNYLDPKELHAIETDRDFREQDLLPVIDHGFSNKRWAKPYYNFRNREYQSVGRTLRNPGNMWPGAKWAPGARRNDQRPWNHQDIYGRWWDRVPVMAGTWPGGRPKPWN